jgi:molybdenum cofactor guanylyltransferase
MNKSHSKHTKLTRRENGFFAPNEIALVGVKCSTISNLVQQVSANLAEEASMAYVDASHENDLQSPTIDVHTYHASGDFSLKANVIENKYNNPLRFSQYDLVFINGNHFQGQKQIVFLDPEKENSIAKRIDQITEVLFFIKTTSEVKIFDCLLEKFSEATNIPIYELSDLEGISNQISKIISANKPVLNGLILAGGKSVRMGTDKGLLEYHGLPQRDFMMQLLEKQGIETFLSVRENQSVSVEKIIPDAFIGLGPFGAIASAFMHNPNNAYLVLATDLPYVDEKLVQLLLSKRNPKKLATAIQGKGKDFMEPLITIWEPKAYSVLLNYLAQGYSCPRKVLINSEVEIVEVEDYWIQNINTPEEFQEVKKQLN